MSKPLLLGVVGKPDALALWAKFGGGPKTEAEAQRRREIVAQLEQGDYEPADVFLARFEAIRPVLAEIERANASPRVAASAIRIVAGGKSVSRRDRDYDPQAVWLAIQAQQRARTEGQA